MYTDEVCFMYEVFKHSTFVVLPGGYKQERGSSEACHSKPHVAQHIPIDLSPAEKGAFQAWPWKLLLGHSTVSQHPRALIALLSHSGIEKSACETGKLPLSVTAFTPQQQCWFLS